MLKKFLCIFIATAFCFSLFPLAYASNLTDNDDLINAEEKMQENDIANHANDELADFEDEQTESVENTLEPNLSEVADNELPEDYLIDIPITEDTGDDFANAPTQQYSEEMLAAYELLCEYIQSNDLPVDISLEMFYEGYTTEEYSSLDEYLNTYYDVLSDGIPFSSSDVDEDIKWCYNAGTTVYRKPNYSKYNLLDTVKAGDIIHEAKGGSTITKHTAIVEGIYYNTRFNQYYIRLIEAIDYNSSGNGECDGVCRSILDDARFEKRDDYVLRVRGATNTIIQNAISFCTRQLGKDYDLLNHEKHSSSNSAEWYCSELVWAAYYNQGIDLDDNGGNYVPPDDIKNSTKTNIVLVSEGGIPSNLSATVNSTTSATILWDAVPNVDKYKVYRSDSIKSQTDAVNGSYTLIGTTTNTYFTDKNLKPSSKYYYRVSGYRQGDAGSDKIKYGESSKSEPIGVNTSFSTPIITYSFCPNSNSVEIRWSAVYDALGYDIYRSTSSDLSTFSLIGTSTNCLFVDASAIPGTTYYYKVVARSADKFSGKSVTVKLTPVIVETPVIFYRNARESFNKIKWTFVPGATSYNVYRSLSENGPYEKIKSGIEKTYYDDDEKITSGTTYYYKVCAVRDGSNSNLSDYRAVTAK